MSFKEAKSILKSLIGENVLVGNNLDKQFFRGKLLFGCMYRNNGNVSFFVCSPDEWNSIKVDKKYTNPGYHIINAEEELAYKPNISDIYHKKIFLKKIPKGDYK